MSSYYYFIIYKENPIEMKISAYWFNCRMRTWSSIACKSIHRESSVMRDVNVTVFSSYSYIKIIYKENPIEMKHSAYWFKCPVIIISSFTKKIL